MTTTTGKQTLHASHGRNRVRRQPKDVAFDVVLYLICAVLLIVLHIRFSPYPQNSFTASITYWICSSVMP